LRRADGIVVTDRQMRFTDSADPTPSAADSRCEASPLGRRVLMQVAGIVTPDTMLRRIGD
jgi:hypothetical protein